MTESLKSLVNLREELVNTVGTESLINAAVENSNEAFVITTADVENPIVVYVNAAFTKMSGYSAQDIIGSTPKILQGKKTDKNILARLKQTLHEGKPFFGRCINYRKDGSEYMLEWHIAVIKKDGKPTHYVSIQRSLNELPLVTQAELDYLLETVV